jgi:transcriptional regulator with XRE-family HTH domain
MVKEESRLHKPSPPTLSQLLERQIESLRLAAGLTASAVAQKAGLSSSMFSRIERGIASPSVDSIDRIAGAALTRELVHCATLAPSSHNTQCWKFAVEDKAITIRPDPARRCPAVDPDDHHLFVTLGCAAENLVQAAQAHELVAAPSFDANNNLVRVGSVAIGVAARSKAAPRRPIRWRDCRSSRLPKRPSLQGSEAAPS